VIALVNPVHICPLWMVIRMPVVGDKRRDVGLCGNPLRPLRMADNLRPVSVSTSSASSSQAAEPAPLIAPLVREVERIADAAQRSTCRDHEVVIESMRREIDQLRRTVAYLRLSRP
jgi:hypothetical protein